MPSVSKIAFRGTVASRDDARPLTINAGDAVIVKRGGRLRSLVMRCPCGCGDDLVINLDSRAGPAWKFYSRSGKLSLYPSYWRDSACGCHFILWKNRISWCGRREDTDEESFGEAIQGSILRRMDFESFSDYRVLAAEMDEIPWDVLWCCRKMATKGWLEEKSGEDHGWFRKLS